MPTEVTLWLTPEEAAFGVTRAVGLPSGPVNVRIPPVRDGDLIRVSTDKGEAHLRIRVGGAPTPQPPGAGRALRRSPLLKPLLVLAALGVLVVVLLTQRDGSSSSAAPGSGRTPSPSTSRTPFSPGTGDEHTAPGLPDPLGSTDRPTRGPSRLPTPPAPYRTGTCLNGTIPDSTTPVKVNNVGVVACSSSDAHYRVIQTFHGTTDMSRCRENSDTQYSFSSETTLGGRTISSVVYCLVGIGSYER
ncbi:LppU/SCO3897 family protein [Streptomyces cinnamoneus]|uniref:Uncharacterized protein n=1 Tax=Streptomyces cinnamoneus TaxID=53446 RepID=A0A918TSD3_STRCJ|nr:hypothetical protein [Streptomyces cinnamoneus]GHC60326.1 hypothetical protein GCM10010507_41780 [Streptomyces cinnamoneus]